MSANNITYRDAGGALKEMEQEPGDAPNTVRGVQGLPDDVRLDIANTASRLATIVTSLSTLDGHIDQLEGYSDGLETLVAATNTALTTLQGYVDGLETLVGTTNTTLTTLNGNVDQLEGYTDGLETLVTATNTALGTVNTALTTLQGYVDQLEGYTDGIETLIGSTNTKLDTLHTDLAPGTTIIEQKTSIGTAADVQFTSATLKKGGTIRNCSTGSQTVYVKMTATPTATDSWLLAPGECTPFLECTNPNVFFMRASATGGAAAFVGS